MTGPAPAAPGQDPAPGSWLWRRASAITTRTWQCHYCAEQGHLGPGGDDAATAHVIRTGHAVEVIYRHTATLEGMRSDAR